MKKVGLKLKAEAAQQIVLSSFLLAFAFFKFEYKDRAHSELYVGFFVCGDFLTKSPLLSAKPRQ